MPTIKHLPSNEGKTQIKGCLYKKFGAEFLGTFALTLTAGAIDILAHLFPNELSGVTRAIAPALVIMAFIYTLGEVSGAHFNPVVTLSFALRRVFPWKHVPLYLLAELVGATAAALLLKQAFPDTFSYALNQPHMSLELTFATEFCLTFLLVSIIIGTAKQHRLLGADAAIPVAGFIAAAGLLGLKISGPSLNPARSLGPALVAGSFQNLGIYLFAPLLGALLATLLLCLLHPRKIEEEAEAANGKE